MPCQVEGADELIIRLRTDIHNDLYDAEADDVKPGQRTVAYPLLRCK